MLRLRPLGHLSADKTRYNIACARGECKQKTPFFVFYQKVRGLKLLFFRPHNADFCAFLRFFLDFRLDFQRIDGIVNTILNYD